MTPVKLNAIMGGRMRKRISSEEVKRIEFDILREFKKFCVFHDLKYSLGAGTLLGAVRHKGFIPWDDDIDVFMKRAEYDRMIDIVNSEHGSTTIDGKYAFKLPLSEEYVYPFIKIVDTSTVVYEKNTKTKYGIGVWIDVFPIDFCHDDILQNEEMINRRREYVTNVRRCSTLRGKGLLRTILKQTYNWIQDVVFKKDVSYWVRKCLEPESDASSKYSGTIMWPITIKDVYPSEFFSEYVELEFEGEMFSVFRRFDEILSWRYGDYMKLPDEKNRHGHGFIAYQIE
jgi:lipopolysaccharide cholinephosphotransferase